MATTTFILKVQRKDEIRRVSLNQGSMTISELEARVVSMFPAIQDFVMMIRHPFTDEFQPVRSDSQLQEILSEVRSTCPPILRIRIVEDEKPLTQVTKHSVEIVKSPAIVFEHAQVQVKVADEDEEEEEVEEGDDEEETEDVEIARKDVDEHLSVAEEEEDEDEETEEGKVSQEPDSICSSCKGYIGDGNCFVRYKCLNCLDVILCEYCERQEVHDPSHLLVKLRVSVQNLPLKQQLVFFSHIEDPVQRLEGRQKRKELRQALKLERREKRKQERLEKKRARKLARALKKAELQEFVMVTSSGTQESLRVPEEQQPQPEVPGVPEEIPPLDLPPPVCPNEVQEEEEDATETVNEEDWSVTSLLDGFQVVPPGKPQEEQEQDEETEKTLDLDSLQIRGFAFGEKLAALEKMGFGDRNKNILLLVKNLLSLEATVEDLVRA